jgi:predicted nucleic acid-binding protein
MIYLDANLFVYARFDHLQKGERARKLLRKIVEKGEAITSVLALDEVMWVVLKNRKQDELRSIIEEIYSIPNLDVKDVPSHIALRALEFMENYKLKPRDAFHVAIMKHFGANTIATDDPDFDKVKEVRRIKL